MTLANETILKLAPTRVPAWTLCWVGFCIGFGMSVAAVVVVASSALIGLVVGALL